MARSTQVVQGILEARRQLIEAFFSGEHGQELIKLGAAYEALTGRQPPSVDETLTSIDAARDRKKAEAGSSPIRVKTSELRGPKEACRELMLTGPDRVWTYDELERHFGEQLIRLDAQNPRDAMRTAMAALAREGIVERVGRGRFKSVRGDTADETRSEKREGWLTSRRTVKGGAGRDGDEVSEG